MSRRYRVLHGPDELTADTSADGVVTIDGRRFHVADAGAGRYRVTADDGVSTLVAVTGAPHETWLTSGGRARQVVVDSAPRRAAAAGPRRRT